MENLQRKTYKTAEGFELLTEWHDGDEFVLYSSRTERAARRLMPELEFIHGRREATAEYTFGLPYTSTGSFAAVWNTNAEARLRGTSLYFEGVAIDAADGRPVGIFTECNAAGDEVQSVCRKI